jgi:SulP family sulfate permease
VACYQRVHDWYRRFHHRDYCTDLLGIHAQTAPPREFLAKIQWLAQNILHSNPASLILAFLVIAIICFWPRFGPKRIPGSVVAMIGATLLPLLLYILAPFDRDHLGIATLASKFGPNAIPQGFPSFRWTFVEWTQIRDLLQPATAIALLGAIECCAFHGGIADGRMA